MSIVSNVLRRMPFSIKNFGVFLGAALLVLLAIASLVVVQTGQAGVVVKQDGALSARLLAEPGLYVRVPIYEKLWLVDTRLQTAEQSNPVPYTTQDQQNVQIVSWLAWKVVDPVLFAQSTAVNQPSVDTLVLAALPKTLQTLLQDQPLNAVKHGLSADVVTRWRALLNTELAPFGVMVEQVGVRQVLLSAAMNEAIYQSMDAARQSAAEQFAQGLLADEQALMTLQATRQDQVLSMAYKNSEQQRRAAEAALSTAYVHRFGVDLLTEALRHKPSQPAPTLPDATSPPARTE